MSGHRDIVIDPPDSEEHLNGDTPDVDRVVPNPGEAQSILDTIRGERNEARVERPHHDLRFPSADGHALIYVRYEPLDDDVMDAIRKRARKSKNPDREFLASLDMIAQACSAILVRGPDGELEALHEMLDQSEPFRFDAELAAQFAGPNFPGLESATEARQIIMKLAGVETFGRLPLERHHVELLEWMSDGIVETDEELLGKS